MLKPIEDAQYEDKKQRNTKTHNAIECKATGVKITFTFFIETLIFTNKNNI